MAIQDLSQQPAARDAEQSQQQAPQDDKPAENTNGINKQESSPQPSPDSSNGRRGRSRTRSTRSDDNLKRRGYHTLMSSFGKAFHVEKRWKLIRELGSGAYGFVISAADEISGEPVAIKMVTRATEKIQLAKRALREITLLRHFQHENITGLIDVDCTPDLSEIYIFMEPMEADLHQIIKSGQTLTNEHVQYFVYQILRGMKYIHSASVIHRDLKPGNLGFNSAPDENTTAMTEYVATRWYRAPEIMLAYKGYSIAIDVWSVGCIFAELLLGRPLFKGKDYVDQLNQILQVLGTPDDEVISRIGSTKAQAYIRSLPIKKTVPFSKVIPTADLQAIDLLTKMLAFDPASRITVADALEHPWLSSYHDTSDEPPCPEIFERWRFIEGLETLDQFRDALWDEIQDYRKEVRSMADGVSVSTRSPSLRGKDPESLTEKAAAERALSPQAQVASPEAPVQRPEAAEATKSPDMPAKEVNGHGDSAASEIVKSIVEPVDPVVAYARRSSIMAPARPSRTNSTYSNHSASQFRSHQPMTSPDGSGAGGESSVVFPGQQDYIVPSRSRTASMYGGTVSRRLLRTLSTVSIYESGEGLAGGLADIAPIAKYIVERDEALPSGMPRELESPPQGTTQSQAQTAPAPAQRKG